MEWQQLLTPKRLGKKNFDSVHSQRTAFVRDYDRLIYSAPFRRLKDKTQVFPLAKNDDIRTRLIHSLEVSCVGRSLGRIVGEQIIKRHHLSNVEAADFGDIVSAACVAHDIGNPPFGHAGENALQAAFKSWYAHPEAPLLSAAEKADLDQFEGNAQGFRILTRLGMPHRYGGLQLTCPTLATFAKYPRESFIPKEILGDYEGVSINKYGFFQAERDIFTEVADTVGLIRRHPDTAWWCRHPLTFLVEAADDICYSTVDLEDGFRMGYLSFEEVEGLLNAIAQVKEVWIGSPRETIERLRAKVINELIQETVDVFLAYEPVILNGKFDLPLLSLSRHASTLKLMEEKAYSSIFHHPNVVSIKIAGYEVLGGLFAEFVKGLFLPDYKAGLLQHMIPIEYRPKASENSYSKLLRLTDYISGMADSSATMLFQQLKGISLN